MPLTRVNPKIKMTVSTDSQIMESGQSHMNENNQLCTQDKLMQAAIDLISAKGYDGVSTREIAAEAGLSEKTLFRHFGSKQNLLEKAYDRYLYAAEMQKIFKENLTGNLHEDLLMISRTYHKIMNRNRKLVMISMQVGDHLPGFRNNTQNHPRQLHEILTNYFKHMSDQGKLFTKDPSLTAVSFMWMNLGAFLNTTHVVQTFTDIEIDAFIEESVRLFTRALTP
ncbi:TetR family transcriptional regulator [Paenibacillus cineris]|nr:TetR family transcriptional regulator [Paenibacillus cineris]